VQPCDAFIIQHWRNVFCFPDPATRGVIDYESNNDKTKNMKMLLFDRKSRGTRKDVTVLGSKEK
jgi:hypothetical protein